MNTRFPNRSHYARVLTLAAAISFTLAGCATTPASPDGAAEVRAKLTRLQADPDLATRAPAALSEAEAAVRVAEQPVARDPALVAHRVYLADRKVEIAMAQAATRYAEDQRVKLGEERERARLAARTREADAARADAEVARASAEASRASAAQAALRASTDAESSRMLADNAARDAALKAEDMQRQIDALQARTTERGIVLTLGDVLFTSGRADLKPGAAGNLGRLVHFLDENPDRSVEIEGHTDSVGGDGYNQDLSQRRADSVRSYLMQKGISPDRIVASGKGEHQPVADNESEGGRQQNRRVEVIIGNPPAVVAAT